MKLLPTPTQILLTLIVACFALACAPRSTPAQCPDVGTLVFDGVTSVEGKPFQASEIMKIVTYSSDGTQRLVVTKSNLFRDSKGRVRVERFYDGSDNAPGNMPSQIAIYDHCGRSVILLPSTREAKVQEIARSKGSDRPFCEEFDPLNLPKASRSGKFENLGQKWIEGVEVLGQRTMEYGSAQAKSSGAPPVHVYETWCSKSLDILISSFVLDDKPKREITRLASDVKLTETDSLLFEIPEGYTTTSGNPNSASPSRESDLHQRAGRP
jgi:hypothetical protein